MSLQTTPNGTGKESEYQHLFLAPRINTNKQDYEKRLHLCHQHHILRPIIENKDLTATDSKTLLPGPKNHLTSERTSRSNICHHNHISRHIKHCFGLHSSKHPTIFPENMRGCCSQVYLRKPLTTTGSITESQWCNTVAPWSLVDDFVVSDSASLWLEKGGGCRFPLD